MTAERECRLSAESLRESVLVIGGDPVGETVADRLELGVSNATETDTPDVAVLAVDASGADRDDGFEFPTLPEATVRFAVVTVTERPTSVERALLDAVSTRVETVVLASGSGPEDLSAAVDALVSIVRDPGIVNVDLADIETVFRSADLATLGVGTGSVGDPTTAVRNAFQAVPRGIETDRAGGVIVDVIGPETTSVRDIDDVVSSIRGRVGPDAHLIWGSAVGTADSVEVRLAVGGVRNARAAPGDDCPRCGSSLSVYSLDGRSVLSCDSCGFADISVRIRS